MNGGMKPVKHITVPGRKKMFNKKEKILSMVLAAVFFGAGLSFADNVGTTGAQFLKIGVGARAVAMGGAFSAVADDVYSIYYNPAGLANQKKRQVASSYVRYFQGINIGFVGYSQKLLKDGVMGIGLNYVSVSDIERRTTDVDVSEGTFGANDSALYLSYANEKLLSSYLKGLNVGANLKIIRQTLDTQTSQSYALDLGALYNTPVKKLTAAFGVYNLGTHVKFISESDPLPLDLRLGLAYRMFNDSFLVAVDANDFVYDERLTEQVGLEYTYNKAISVRGGYIHGIDSEKLGGLTGFSAGVGFNIWGIQLDYAFVPYGELSDTHRISIATKF
jgi:hypothetical protein